MMAVGSNRNLFTAEMTDGTMRCWGHSLGSSCPPSSLEVGTMIDSYDNAFISQKLDGSIVSCISLVLCALFV